MYIFRSGPCAQQVTTNTDVAYCEGGRGCWEGQILCGDNIKSNFTGCYPTAWCHW